MKRWELNEQAYEDIILSINYTPGQGKVAFSLVKNCISDEYPEGIIKCTYCGTEGHSKFKCELKKARQKCLGKEKASLAIEKDDEKFDEMYIDDMGF